MAIGIHVVRTAFLTINRATNLPMKNDDVTVTLKGRMDSESRHVVLPDDSIPNSLSYPAVPRYLELEASGNYVLHHIDQNMIVTYDQGDINSAT